MMAGSLRWDHYEVRVTTGAAGEVAPAARAALAVEPEAPVTGRGALLAVTAAGRLAKVLTAMIENGSEVATIAAIRRLSTVV